jgi:hypothetical protein
MSDAMAQELLTASGDELAGLERRVREATPADVPLHDAVVLSIAARAALAESVGAMRPREPTSVVIARHKRRWRFRVIFVTIFVPLGALTLALFGTAVWALVTAFVWRP